MAVATTRERAGRATARPARRRFGWAWLGLVPFFLFSIAFMFLPVVYLVIGSFRERRGPAVRSSNYADLSTGIIPDAFATSIEISLVTAIARRDLRVPARLRPSSSVACRAFLRTRADDVLRRGLELRRRPARPGLHLHPRQARLPDRPPREASGSTLPTRLQLTTKLGLELVYMYFQFPLMVLIIAPALDGLKREWREAAENMGASASSTGATSPCRS